MEWPELACTLGGHAGPVEIAEAGTGQGALFAYLLDLLRPVPGEWRLTTLDIAREPVAAAGAKLAMHPAHIRTRVAAIQGDVVELAGRPEHRRRYDIVCASALLSAVPLSRQWGVGDVLRSLRDLLRPGGQLFLEDYLPLPPAPAQGSPPGAGGSPETTAAEDAAEVARSLWRWNKAIAELAGRPHYTEVPPDWVAVRLDELGFMNISISVDERQAPRPGDEQAEFLQMPAAKPESLDPALWLALDRYRRDLLRKAAEGGLVQWSGSYRVRACLCPAGARPA